MGNCQKHQPHKIKHVPQQQKSKDPLAGQQKALRPVAIRFMASAGQTRQAIAAQHAVIMLGNALTAIVMPAFQAAHHRFALRVVVAMLIGDSRHT